MLRLSGLALQQSPAAAAWPVRRLQRVVDAKLRQGEVDGACAVLRRWVAGAEPSALHPDRLSDRLRVTIRHAVAAGLKAADSSSNVPSLTSTTLVSSSTPPVATASLQSMASLSIAIGDWSVALAAMGHLRRRGVDPSGEAIALTLRAENALAVLDWARRHRVAFNPLMALRLLASKGRWDVALEVARRFDHASGHAESYTVGVVVPFLANGGQWRRAARVLTQAMLGGAALHPALVRSIVEQTARPATWVGCLALASAFAKARAFDELAFRSPRLYRLLVETCPDWATAMAIVERAIASGVAPSRSLVAAVMARCEDAGRWQEAMAVLARAKEAGFVSAVGPESRRALIASFRASAAWDRALRAASWMAVAGDAASDVGLPVLLDMCAAAGRWEAVAAVSQAMLGGGDQASAGAAAVSSTTRTSTGAPALPRAAAAPAKPSHSHANLPAAADASVTFDQLIRALARGGKWADATAALGRMVHDERVPAVHPATVDAVVATVAKAAPTWALSVAVLVAAEGCEPRVVVGEAAYASAVKRVAGSGEWALSLQLCTRMRERGHRLSPGLLHTAIAAASFSDDWQTGLAFTRFLPPVAWRTADGRRVLKQLLAASPRTEHSRLSTRFAAGRF